MIVQELDFIYKPRLTNILQIIITTRLFGIITRRISRIRRKNISRLQTEYLYPNCELYSVNITYK
jgi:hypothetical protein